MQEHKKTKKKEVIEMGYKKTIEAMDQIRNAKIEIARFGDRTNGANLEVDGIKRQAFDEAKKKGNVRDLKRLKEKAEYIQYDFYYNETQAELIEKLYNLEKELDLQSIIDLEQSDLKARIKKLDAQLNVVINKSRDKVIEALKEAEKEAEPILMELKEHENDERYVFYSQNIWTPHLYLLPGISGLGIKNEPLLHNYHVPSHGTIPTYARMNITDEVLGGK